MNEMKRLTAKLVDGCFMPKRMIYDNKSYCEEYCIGPCDDDCPINACFQKLADYEDAEEQGRLIEFPVSIGDALYYVPDWMSAKCIDEVRVRGYRLLDGNCKLIEIVECEPKRNLIDGFQNVSRIGKDLFRTMDEAEARLKELGGQT